MRKRAAHYVVLGFGVVFATMVACGGRVAEERSGSEDAGSSADAGRWRSVDARELDEPPSVHITGPECFAREEMDLCTPSAAVDPVAPDLQSLIRECASKKGRSPCIEFTASVDGRGCITDLSLESGTDKEAMLQCIADAVATRRWSCARAGDYPFFHGCTLEK